jgi:hypothetical protein
LGTVKVTAEWMVPVLSVVLLVPDRVNDEPLKVAESVGELAA